LQKSLQAGQTTLTQSLQSSQQVLIRLNTQIGELQGTNKQMLQIGTEVRRLQDILSSPKLRGQMVKMAGFGIWMVLGVCRRLQTSLQKTYKKPLL
jgi:DNA anti-recombination protein RmuC